MKSSHYLRLAAAIAATAGGLAALPTAASAESYYGGANLGGGGHFDGFYATFTRNRVTGDEGTVCAGQSTQGGSWYGGYVCGYKEAFHYYDSAARRPRAHNGEGNSQFVFGWTNP